MRFGRRTRARFEFRISLLGASAPHSLAAGFRPECIANTAMNWGKADFRGGSESLQRPALLFLSFSVLISPQSACVFQHRNRYQGIVHVQFHESDVEMENIANRHLRVDSAQTQVQIDSREQIRTTSIRSFEELSSASIVGAIEMSR